MKKSLTVFIILILIGLGLYFFVGKYQFSFGDFQFFFNSDKGKIAEMSKSFLEDIQFKDYDSAAMYHSPEDQEKADIPKLIERVFKIKPEFLDIMRYEIKDVELDQSKSRAKVRVHSVVRVLNTEKIKEPELILYWHKSDEGKWYMELHSSLQ